MFTQERGFSSGSVCVVFSSQHSLSHPSQIALTSIIHDKPSPSLGVHPHSAPAHTDELHVIDNFVRINPKKSHNRHY